VDAYDAIRSVRPYRDPAPEEQALEEMKRCRGTHFDPDVLDAFLKCRTALEEIACWDEQNLAGSASD
jgi:putative two-component system response regulator